MDYALKEYLLNIFFIMLPLIFYQFTIHERMEERAKLKSVLALFVFGIPILLCMFFPIVVESSFIYDLRLIPLILSCMYSSFITSLLLYFILIYFRFMIAVDSGAYLNIVVTTVTFILIVFISKKYPSMSLIKKIIAASLILFISRMLIKSLFFIEYGVSNFQLLSMIKFYIIQSLFMGIAIYIIEAIKKNAQLRKEVIDSEKMKVASSISASVAHEIRNPLTTIRGFIQLLSTSDLTQDKKIFYGQICIEELDRAQQIISDYLSLAKPQPDIIDKLDLSSEIKYISHVLTSYANLNGVIIEIETDTDRPLFILGDRQKFRQSIINIAKNSIEAMIASNSRVLKFEMSSKKNLIHLVIKDTGIGMNADQVSRLGTPYYSTKEKGTGLGTMVSFSILKAMIGKVEVKSELGKGTEYNIFFPMV